MELKEREKYPPTIYGTINVKNPLSDQQQSEILRVIQDLSKQLPKKYLNRKSIRIQDYYDIEQKTYTIEKLLHKIAKKAKAKSKKRAMIERQVYRCVNVVFYLADQSQTVRLERYVEDLLSVYEYKYNKQQEKLNQAIADLQTLEAPWVYDFFKTHEKKMTLRKEYHVYQMFKQNPDIQALFKYNQNLYHKLLTKLAEIHGQLDLTDYLQLLMQHRQDTPTWERIEEWI